MLSLKSYASCLDVEDFDNHIQNLLAMSQSLNLRIPNAEAPGEDRSVFMDLYALGARWHMTKYGSNINLWTKRWTRRFSKRIILQL